MVKTRKFFAMAIVFSMILTLFAGIATVSAADAPDYSSSMERMKKFNVIIGDPDGQLRPEADVLRSEFLTILVRALGYEDAANAAKGATRFTDVPAEHWASGYINVAVSLGITVGTTETTFSPDDKVELIEAVAMIERSMGYEVVAKEKGGYPVGHLVVARDKNLGLNLLDGVTQSSVLPASRGLVAKLFDNGLAAPFYEIDSYSNGVPTYKQNKDVTFLSKLGYEKLQIVDGEDSFILAMTPNFGADENKVKLLSITNRNAGATGLVEKELNGTFDLDSFMGKRVEAYVDGDGKIVDIQLSEADKTVEVAAVEISKDGNKIKIKDEEGTETKYEVEKGLLPYVANWEFGVAENAEAFDANGAFGNKTGLIEANAVIYDGKVDFVYGYKYTAPAQITGVVDNGVTGAKRIAAGATYYIDKDKDNQAKFVEIIKDGVAVELSDVEEDDIVYVASLKNATDADNAKDNRIRFVIITETVVGELKAATLDGNGDATKVKIDSTTYDVNTATKLSNWKVSYGDTVKARMTRDGKVFSLEKEDGSVAKDYAIVLNKATENGRYGAQTKFVKLLTSNGDKIEYTVKKDSALDTNFANFSKGQLVKFELDSENNLINLTGAQNAAANTKVKDVEKRMIGSSIAAEDAILFNLIDDNADNNDDADASVITWANITDGANASIMLQYFMDDDNSFIEVAKFDNASGGAKYGVITDKYSIKDGKNHITLITEDGVVEFDSSEAITHNIGDFVTYTVNGDNKVATADANVTEIAVAEIESVNASNIKLNGNVYVFADDVVVYYNKNLSTTEDFEALTVADLYKFMQAKLYTNAEGLVVGVAVSVR